MANNTVSRVFGGSPAMVLFRLVMLSVLVGVILSALGLDPLNIIPSLRRIVQTIWSMGFDAVEWTWRYFLLGAIVVIPVWLLMRLFKRN